MPVQLAAQAEPDELLDEEVEPDDELLLELEEELDEPDEELEEDRTGQTVTGQLQDAVQ